MYTEDSFLIWKWNPKGANPEDSKRANSIRWGSQLRVKEGQVAIFIHTSKLGTQRDIIVGPTDVEISTQNLPVISGALGLLYNGDSPFSAEIYFINTQALIQTKFAVPYFDVFEPELENFSVPVAVRGTFNFKISDYDRFIDLHSLTTFTQDSFDKQIASYVARTVKDIITNAPSNYNMKVLKLESKINEINDIVSTSIGQKLKDEYAVEMTSLDISAIDVDKTSEGYQQLTVVTKDIETAKIKAKSEKEIKDILSDDNGDDELDSQIDKVKKLKELLDVGVLTQEEFDAKKKQILGL